MTECVPAYGQSNNNTWCWWADSSHRQTNSPSHQTCSEGQKPTGTGLHSSQ